MKQRIELHRLRSQAADSGEVALVARQRRQAPVVVAPPPPAPPPPKPAPNRNDITVACPTQVAPEMPRKAQQEGIEGVVRAQIRIKAGVIQEVTIVSGPRVFHAAVRAAMLQYKCVSDAGGEVTATQEFNFKLE